VKSPPQDRLKALSQALQVQRQSTPDRPISRLILASRRPACQYIAGLDIAGPDFAGLDIAGLDGILQDIEVTVRRLFLAGNPIGSM
jgi:hypothetical protein